MEQYSASVAKPEAAHSLNEDTYATIINVWSMTSG
jgi:hypothetical protein